MTKLHFIHDWRVIAEKNIVLPYNYSEGRFRLASDENNAWCNRKEFNVTVFRCWKCDRMRHVIMDANGKDLSKDLQLWVVKKLVGLGPDDTNTSVS